MENELKRKLDTKLIKLTKQYDIQARIYSEKLNWDYTFLNAGKEIPYNIASISKIFTAIIIFMLIEEGKLNLEDKIAGLLPIELLKNLFVYQKIDYAEEVTIHNLLSHSSGCTAIDKKMMKKLISEPNKIWTPEMTFDFVRNQGASIGKPGECYNYSEINYNLLGKIIEATTKKTYPKMLHEYIFGPLKMNDSYLMHHSKPKNELKPIEKIWYLNHEVSTYKCLSSDWAGAGIVSTTSDLLKFNSGLHNDQLITKTSLLKMQEPLNVFRPDIDYGLGTMSFELGRNHPRLYGHTGNFVTHLYYDPISKTHIVLNFGNEKAMIRSFDLLIVISRSIGKLIQ